MKIKYKGNADEISFTKGEVYKAKKLDIGYAIFDDSGEAYRYGDEFVRNSFEIIEE